MPIAPTDIGVYVISLEERDDRRAAVRAHLEAFGVGERARFVLRQRDTRDSAYGCFESHAHVWRTATEPYVLVFEDDVVLNPDLSGAPTLAQLWPQLREALASHAVVYLGAASQAVERAPWRTMPELGLAFHEGRFTLAHAYIARRATLQEHILPGIAPWHQLGIQIDWALVAFLGRRAQLSVFPPVFLQRSFADSDNLWVNIPLIGVPLTRLSQALTVRLLGNTQVPALLGWCNALYFAIAVRARAAVGRWQVRGQLPD